MTNFVQQYRSTNQSSWPALSGTAGSMIALLDAILVNGGTTQSVTSLTESGTTYTAVIGADLTLVTGTWITISGASPAGANITGPITVTDSTHFTLQGPGSLGTITGTILYKRTGLGWTKPFTAANRAAFLPAAVSGFPQFYLRIEEDGNSAGGQKECVATGWETMSDVNTGTGKFPTDVQVPISGTATQGGECWRKSTTADATARSWILFGDGATFYLIVNSDATTNGGRIIAGFGGFTSFKAGDAYNGFICGTLTFNLNAPVVANCGLSWFSTLAGPTLTASICAARSFSQVGGSVTMAHTGYFNTATGVGSSSSGTITYPNGSDTALWVQPTLFWDIANVVRGKPRGIFVHCHNVSAIQTEFDKATNVAGLSGVTLTWIDTVANNVAAHLYFDTFGPW